MKEDVEKKIDLIIENHLTHIKEDLVGVKNDIAWLTKFQWLILATALGSLFTNLLR